MQEEVVLRLQVCYSQMTAAAESRSGRRPIGVSEDVTASIPTTAWSKASVLVEAQVQAQGKTQTQTQAQAQMRTQAQTW